jgi:hypothetical protein
MVDEPDYSLDFLLVNLLQYPRFLESTLKALLPLDLRTQQWDYIYDHQRQRVSCSPPIQISSRVSRVCVFFYDFQGV